MRFFSMACRIDVDSKEEKKKSKLIDELIREDRWRREKVLKLLLLGSENSGKSTFVKQMGIHSFKGFTEDSRRECIPILRANCLDSMKNLLIAFRNWNTELGDTIQPLEDEIMAATQLTEGIAKYAELIWKSPVIQKAIEQRMNTWDAHVTKYYLENAVCFAREDFLPTQIDMLRVKRKKKGVLETSLEWDGISYKVVEVGHRSESKKWFSCFTDVEAIIYLVALNEYDMVIEEDGITNQMEKSLKLFQKLSSSKWLKDTPFFLCLNKSDLFAEKIRIQPLTKIFEDYDEFAKGNNSFGTSCEYILSRYRRAFNGSRLYPLFTSITHNFDSVVTVVNNIIWDNLDISLQSFIKDK